MNTNELYELHDRNDESIYFLDKACTMPYTGHIEEYFKGQLSMESDVVEGYRDGICKKLRYFRKIWKAIVIITILAIVIWSHFMWLM